MGTATAKTDHKVNAVYTLDTNAIIYYLNETEARVMVDELIRGPALTYASTITELELFSYPSLTPQETANIERVLRSITVIPVNSAIARLAGLIRKQFRLKLADAAIAATALATDSTLVTRNVRDFQNVPGLLLKKV